MSDKKYSNLHPKQLLKLKQALEIGATSSPGAKEWERKKLEKEIKDEAKLEHKKMVKTYRKKMQIEKKKYQTLRWKDRKAKDSD